MDAIALAKSSAESTSPFTFRVESILECFGNLYLPISIDAIEHIPICLNFGELNKSKVHELKMKFNEKFLLTLCSNKCKMMERWKNILASLSLSLGYYSNSYSDPLR